MSLTQIRLNKRWDGTVVSDPHEQVLLQMNFESTAPAHLSITVDAPFFDDPAPVSSDQNCEGLWNFEAIEVFIKGRFDKYIELAIGPHNHFLILACDSYKQCFVRKLEPVSYVAQIDRTKNRWTGCLKVPIEFLPPPSDFPNAEFRFNAYAARASGSVVHDGRNCLVAFPPENPTGPYYVPDFHRLELFGPLPVRDKEVLDQLTNSDKPSIWESRRTLSRELMETLPALGPPAVKQVAKSRINLEIIPELKIGVFVYLKSKIMNMPTLTKLASDGGGVKIDRTFTRIDDPYNNVPESERLRAWRYGSEYVPLLNEDLEGMKFLTDKCLKVIGFFPKEKFPVYKAISNCDCIAAEPQNVFAQMGLSALFHALLESDRVAVARFSYQKNAAPKLVCMYPIVEQDYECFHVLQMPYSEDSRENTLVFPSLGRPSEEVSQSVEDFVTLRTIDSMPSPDTIPNPTLNRFYKTVQQRLDLQARGEKVIVGRVASASGEIKGLMCPELKLWSRSELKRYGDAIVESAKLVEVTEDDQETKRRKKYWREVHNRDLVASPDSNIDVKRIRIESTQESEFENTPVIGRHDPLADFSIAVADVHSGRTGATVPSVMKRMAAVLTDLVNERPPPIDLILNCMLSFRSACIVEDEPKVFNEFLSELSQNNPQEVPKLWREILRQELLLITNEETPVAKLEFSKRTEFVASLLNRI